MPAQAPTHAFRLKVSASATSTAGMIRAAQSRSCSRMNMTRAAATHATSMMSPEYVM